MIQNDDDIFAIVVQHVVLDVDDDEEPSSGCDVMVIVIFLKLLMDLDYY